MYQELGLRRKIHHQENNTDSVLLVSALKYHLPTEKSNVFQEISLDYSIRIISFK